MPFYISPLDMAAMMLDVVAFFVLCVGLIAVIAVGLSLMFPGDRDDSG